jgi:TonB family protein
MLALLLTAALAAAPPQPRPDQPVLVTRPDWLELPDAEQLARAYPRLAAALSIEGHATISCKVNPAGRLHDCTVIEEQPTGFGFGAGAIEMSAAFEMRPQTRNGLPVDGGVAQVPIKFALPRSVDKPPPEPKPTSPAALDLARRLVQALHVQDGPLNQFDEAASELELVDAQDLSDQVRSHAVAAMREAARVDALQLTDDLAKLYAATLSAEELKAMLAFYGTPSGASVMKNNDDTRAIDQVVSREAGRLYVEAARTVFCASHDCATETLVATDSEPAWAEEPSEDIIDQFRPDAANALRLGGTARLACTANEQGFLTKCAVVSEAPRGVGLGAAALQLRGYYRLTTGSIPADPAQTVPLIVRFATPDAEDAAQAPPPRSARALQLARDYLVAEKRVESARATWREMAQKPPADPRRALPPAERAAVLDALRQGLDRSAPQADEFRAAYLTHQLSDQALIDGAAFWRSPAGQAWLAKSPQLEIDSNLVAARWSVQVLADTGRRLCGVVGCTQRAYPATPQPARAASSEPSTRRP